MTEENEKNAYYKEKFKLRIEREKEQLHIKETYKI